MVSWTTIVQAASTTDDRDSLMKSVETRGRSSKPRMPFSSFSDAALRSALTSSAVVLRETSNTQSVSEPLHSGTRTARPLSLPLRSGKTSAIAVAEPVEVGARLTMPERPRRRSCFLPVFMESTRVWVPVTLWMVVIMPFSITSFSWITLTTGARQLVVQEAAVTIAMSAVSLSSLTPMTTLRTEGSLTGADTTTFFTPASR
mmetsp:Transcript_12334/g.29886  ORF Transcript_12334/g.29886 Transcript_12334/m.29886 type:complete len:202 (+) Transcript_12334:162-767(+)